MLTEEQRKEIIGRIRDNDESITQMLDNLTQYNSDAVFDAHQTANKVLEDNPIGHLILNVGIYEYNTRIFNNLLDRHHEESSSDDE